MLGQKRPRPPLWRIALYTILIVAFLIVLGYFGTEWGWVGQSI